MRRSDILVPRRLHSTANAYHQSADSVEPTVGLAMLGLCRTRQQATGFRALDNSAHKVDWQYIDQGVARAVPTFNEPMWTLADVARWVVERTAQAVDGLSIDEDKLPEALIKIHDALSRDQIAAWSATSPESVPRQLPPATWSVHVFTFKLRDGLLHLHIIRSARSTKKRKLTDVLFKSVEVRRFWPSAKPI